MLSKVLLTCSIALTTVACSTTQSKGSIANEIVNQFSVAVETKDVEAFKSLFLNESVTWLAIVSGADFAANYRSDPSAKKVNAHEIVPFIEWASKSEEATEVRFFDCKSSGDGDVMATDCGYAFYLGGKRTNFGRECFLLINTESGWKISGMAFSSASAEKD
jgi:hypothetical protein